MNTEAYEDCMAFGHDWVEYYEMTGNADIWAGQECKWCGEERDNG